MAKPSIALSELLEKGADSDLLREMIQHIVQRVMEMDVENICAASYGERSPERQNSRNGYRELTLVRTYSSNDEVERRGVALTRNEAALSQSSTPSLAHRRCGPRSLEPIVR